VAGPTYIRYAAARILYSSNPGFQAHVTIDDSDPDVPLGSRLRVQVWDVSGGGAPDVAANLEDDAALCIQVIVNQPGEPKRSPLQHRPRGLHPMTTGERADAVRLQSSAQMDVREPSQYGASLEQGDARLDA